ncbi:hypothetical protein [Arthrobacter globiformis]|uniref:hypothetical protein n=1 Tax=Arthrobacter globiformis TaxID=1665 RepID=UPI001CB94314|nr:hypothetical protein [Arthrobacter globiformis]
MLRLEAPYPPGGDSNVVATNHVVSNVISQHVVLGGSATRSEVLDSGARSTTQPSAP